MPNEERDDHTHSTARLEAFSDGVMAIIVTLLILEIKIPELHDLSNPSVVTALIPLIPKFIGFAVSFVTICIFWVNHHHFMHEIKRADRALLWYNNHLLFWLAIVPFVTAFIGEYPTQPIVVALYGLVLMMGAVAFTLMIRYVFFKGRLVDEHVPHKIRKKEFLRSFVGVVMYSLASVAAFANPYISLWIFVLLPLYFFLPRQLADALGVERVN